MYLSVAFSAVSLELFLYSRSTPRLVGLGTGSSKRTELVTSRTTENRGTILCIPKELKAQHYIVFLPFVVLCVTLVHCILKGIFYLLRKILFSSHIRVQIIFISNKTGNK